MNFYVVACPSRGAGDDRIDWRRASVVSGHTERAVAERMAEGLRRHNLFERVYAVCAREDLRGHARRRQVGA